MYTYTTVGYKINSQKINVILKYLMSIFLTHVVLDVVDQWCDPIISVIMIVSEIGQIGTHLIGALKLKCLMFICICRL